MDDPTTIALNLTFFGTLGVAFVMFVGLFLVFVATLLIAGLGRLVGVAVMALFGRQPRQDLRNGNPCPRPTPDVQLEDGQGALLAPDQAAQREGRSGAETRRPQGSACAVRRLGGSRCPGRCARGRQGQGCSGARSESHRSRSTQPGRPGGGSQGRGSPGGVRHGPARDSQGHTAFIREASRTGSVGHAGYRVTGLAGRPPCRIAGHVAGGATPRRLIGCQKTGSQIVIGGSSVTPDYGKLRSASRTACARLILCSLVTIHSNQRGSQT